MTIDKQLEQYKREARWQGYNYKGIPTIFHDEVYLFVDKKDLKSLLKQVVLDVVGEAEVLYEVEGISGHKNAKLIIRNKLRERQRDRLNKLLKEV